MSDKKLKDYYQNNFAKHGVHENSLGWTKGKQNIRFSQLTRHFQLNGKSLIDIGCGFGDIHTFFKLNDIHLNSYLGFDVVPEFIKVAQEKWPTKQNQFILGNYLEQKNLQADYIVASGIFGHRLFATDKEQYAYMEQVFSKAISEAKTAIAFDFMSDKTDFKSGESDFHTSPSIALDIAYKFSRNIILDNSAMPFEFALTIFKDQNFAKEKTVFDKFLADNKEAFNQGRL